MGGTECWRFFCACGGPPIFLAPGPSNGVKRVGRDVERDVDRDVEVFKSIDNNKVYTLGIDVYVYERNRCTAKVLWV